jgi:uncharacterized circularly permuted ATP-grasp superfamily protein
VALTEGSLIVNSSQGGGSKDTWVVEERGAAMPQQQQSQTFETVTKPAEVNTTSAPQTRPEE